jgi:hypothetical protein
MKHFSKAIAISLLALLPIGMQTAGIFAAQESVVMLSWDSRSFKGMTEYSAATLDGERVLHAVATDSASALYRNQPVDLSATPYLHWRWRIEQAPVNAKDELTKAGDDYQTRVYVVRRNGWAFWRTKAINYVWSGAQPSGSRWPNPFAGEAVQMWALNSGTAQAGQWQTHVRDIRADWFAAFGERIDSLDGLALMTDTDNAGGSASSWYADIHFSASP